MIGSANLKIVHVVASLDTGGAERFVIDLSCKQQNASILSFGQKVDSLVPEVLNKKVPLYILSQNSFVKLIQAFIYLNKFDLIHIHSPHVFRFLRHIIPFINKQIIYTRHGASAMNEEHWITLHKTLKKYVSGMSFVSLEGQNNFNAIHCWRDIPQSVVDNGVNLDDVIIGRGESEKFRVGSVGRMVPLKNQISLLKALLNLRSSVCNKIQLHFFGDGELMPELKSFVEKHSLQKQVVFHGVVSDRGQIYNNIDALAVTSETEGLSLAIMEAMAYACPILATNVGGNPKLVKHKENGYLFDYDDEKKLAIYLEELSESNSLYNEFGERSREIVKNNFSLDICASRYLQLYSGQLGKKK